MSSPTKKTAQLSPPSPSVPPHPTDLTAIAAMLNEAAQALLRFGKGQETPESGDNAPHDDEREPSGPIEEGYRRGEFHEEIRCFRLPHFTVRREYELLQQHKQATFYHLVNRVYDDLFTTILLMRHLDDSTEISGFELHLISDNLSRPLEVLSSVCSQLADFELVQKTTVPA